MRRLLDTALVRYDEPTPERYAYMASNSSGNCVLLDADGLCALQRECGAEAISSACRMYPRAVHIGAAAEPVCSGSCEAVIERLIEDTEPLSFSVVEKEITSDVPSETQGSRQIELRIKCIEVIQNQNEDMISRILELGRLLLGCEPPFMMHDPIAYLRAAYDLISKLSASSPVLAEWGCAALDVLGVTGHEDIMQVTYDHFSSLMRQMKNDIPQINTYFGKIFANHMYYEQFPYTEGCRNVREAYVALCAAFVLVTFISVCCYDSNRKTESFVDAVSFVFRTLEHSAFYKNANIVLKAGGNL